MFHSRKRQQNLSPDFQGTGKGSVNQGGNNFPAQTMNLIAILAAFSLFLSTVEYMIPKPMPFMRIGLANLPLLIGLSLLGTPGYSLLVILKVVGQGLLNGTLFSYIFLFSAGGSAGSALVMFFLYHFFRKYLSYVGISALGAAASNIIQLFLAQVVLFGNSIWLIAPPFLLMGFITSIILGLFVNSFTEKSQWYRERFQSTEKNSLGTIQEDLPQAAVSAEKPHRKSELLSSIRENKQQSVNDSVIKSGRINTANIRLLAGFLMIPPLLLNNGAVTVGIQAALLLVNAAIHGRRIRIIPTAVLLVTIPLINLLQVNGKVLFTIGSLDITSGALDIGFEKALTLIGMIYLSQYMVSGKPEFPGKLGKLLSRQFIYFEHLVTAWKRPARGSFTSSLDVLLFSLEGRKPGEQAEENRIQNSIDDIKTHLSAGIRSHSLIGEWVKAGTAAILVWGIFLYPLLG